MSKNLLPSSIADFTQSAEKNFAIGNPNSLPNQNDLTKIADLSYFVADTLDIIHAYDSTDNYLGFFIGNVIDTKAGKVHHEKIIFPNEFHDKDVDAYIENNVYSLSGSFLFVLAIRKIKRLYLDACGTLPAVFDPKKLLAGGTSAILLTKSEYIERFNERLYNILEIQKDGWFPGTLTAHSGVFRLLPNHYLDMITWKTQRHWPCEHFTENPNVDETINFIGQQISNQTQALIEDGEVTIALTGGGDSRLVMAANHKNMAKLSFTTICADPKDPSRDEQIASQITEIFKLKHNILPRIEAKTEEQAVWHLQTGHCLGGPNMHFHPSTQPLSKYKYFLTGIAGEIASGFFWRSSDTTDSKVTSRTIVTRLGMRLDTETLENIDEWFENIKHMNTLTILDLAYLELREGSWAFAQSYTRRSTTEIHPLVSRAIFNAMYTLPEDIRRNGKWRVRGIELFSHELLTIPINSQGFLLDSYSTLKRGLLNPALILRRLRRKLL